MQLRKTRWSKVYESSEEELIAFLDSRRIQTTRIASDVLDDRQELPATAGTTLWWAEGSAAITVDGSTINLQPGDTLVIPAAAGYSVQSGISGYVYYRSV